MPSSPRPLSDITSYHAHIYFDPATTRAEAERLRGQIAERFEVRLGRWHQVPVGPHGQAMFQVAFSKPLFDSFVPWLMLNRGPLSVFVHPNTDNQRLDHDIHPLWMGAPVPIYPEVVPETPIDDENEPNTDPTLEP